MCFSQDNNSLLTKVHLFLFTNVLENKFYTLYISDRYLHIEKELIAEFLIAHRDVDRRKMKRVAFVLSNFKVSEFSWWFILLVQVLVVFRSPTGQFGI